MHAGAPESESMTSAVKLTGFALFMTAIAVTAWWWLGLGAHASARGGAGAALIDVGLFSLFALHHSLLARPRARALVARLLPPTLVRSAYVWFASLLLMAMCAMWQPVGRELYRTTGIVAAALLLVQATGVTISVLAVRRISVKELGGLAEPRPTDGLEFAGPYGLVRHPLYLGWVLIFFAAPHMTGDRLLFAGISTLYLVLAIPLEEAGLAAQFGESYAAYRRAVRWRLIPYLH